MSEGISQENLYDSNYIAQTIRDILCNQFDYMRYLNGFYGDGKFLAYIRPFREQSVLHSFIGFVAADIIYNENANSETKTEQKGITFSETGELIKESESEPLLIEEAFDFYGIDHISFEDRLRSEGNEPLFGVTEDDIDEYLEDMIEGGEFETLLESITEEVFPILFQDHNLLEILNRIMANQVNSSRLDEIDEEYVKFFSESGVLKEVFIPLWVKKEINSRDKGQCVSCGNKIIDISDVSQSSRFCYVVPLAEGGLNDVTNIQMLCRVCDPNIHEDPRQQSLW